MSITATAFDFQHIGTAWRFVLECEDEDPRAYGVDCLPLLPMRRDGVHRQRVCGELAEEGVLDAWGVEDALIARLEGAGEDDDELVCCEDTERAVDDAAGDDEPEALWAAPLREDEGADDPAEALTKREGLGHRAPREVLLLRFAA